MAGVNQLKSYLIRIRQREGIEMTKKEGFSMKSILLIGQILIEISNIKWTS